MQQCQCVRWRVDLQTGKRRNCYFVLKTSFERPINRFLVRFFDRFDFTTVFVLMLTHRGRWGTDGHNHFCEDRRRVVDMQCTSWENGRLAGNDLLEGGGSELDFVTYVFRPGFQLDHLTLTGLITTETNPRPFPTPMVRLRKGVSTASPWSHLHFFEGPTLVY